MSRKNRAKPASRVAIPPTGGTAADADQLADAALAAARYKEAIEHFKDLLKRERRATWLDGLAVAYAGRAGQLAAKGMLKEALALWRTRAEACQAPLLDGPYVRWLMQAGQIELALEMLPSVDQLPPAARDAARAQLAPAVLVAPDHLLTGLSDESRAQRAAARAAIAACAQGDAQGLELALQAISFRSPYRDLRPLLKALVLRATDPPAAAAALARVPDQGPFQALAQVLRVCLLPGTDWFAGLRGLDDAGRALVLELKGCPQPQRTLLLDLLARSAHAAPAPQDLLDLLLRHRRLMANDVARRLCLRLLPHVPQRLDAVRANLPPLDASDQERVLALAAELKQRHDLAEEHWLRLVKLLRHAPNGARRAALVLRRLADEHAHHSPDGSLCVHALDWLTQSLKLDPGDRDTHLRLLRDARLSDDLKQARRWLDDALRQFPGDALILQEAVETALAAGAYKKAAGLAKQVLDADPLNPRVRALVGKAHLAHARKLIGNGKLPAARRELDEAANWLRSASERGLLGLLRGLATEPAAAGDALLRQGVADLGGLLVGTFHLLLEGKRISKAGAFAPQDLVRRAGVDVFTTPDAAEVVALAQALHASAQRDAAVPVAVGVMSGMLGRAAASLRWSESDYLLICEALHRHELTDLTGRFAGAALEHWPGRPVFIYFVAASRFGAAPWQMPPDEWQRLDRVFEVARDQGDERTATRLSKLLGAADGVGGFGLPPRLPDLGRDGDFGNVMEQLLKIGGEDQILEMARQELGKALFEQVRREVNGSKRQFAQALIRLLTAAEALEAGPAPDIQPPPARRPREPRRSASATQQPDLFDD